MDRRCTVMVEGRSHSCNLAHGGFLDLLVRHFDKTSDCWQAQQRVLRHDSNWETHWERSQLLPEQPNNTSLFNYSIQNYRIVICCKHTKFQKTPKEIHFYKLQCLRLLRAVTHQCDRNRLGLRLGYLTHAGSDIDSDICSLSWRVWLEVHPNGLSVRKAAQPSDGHQPSRMAVLEFPCCHEEWNTWIGPYADRHDYTQSVLCHSYQFMSYYSTGSQHQAGKVVFYRDSLN